jgi:predicted GNAT superfamily acetyltransferase
MASPAKSGRTEPFHFRRLDKPEEFRQVEEVTRAIWGPTTVDALPPALQRAVQDNGGFVLGAFADIYLAGFVASFLGWDGKSLYLYAHQLGVRPEYQNHRLGFQLMQALRAEVLQLGLPEVRWVFDPLQSRNAWLFVRRLGGQPGDYLNHYYGQLPDAINEGVETDRIRLSWTVASPRVERRMGGEFPTREQDRARWERSASVIRTETGESGQRVPTEVEEPQGPSAHLEIPFDFGLVREHEPTAVRRWRHATRDALRAASDVGYEIDDFAVVTTDHERRGFYFLRPASLPAAGGSEASPADPARS